MKIPHYRMTSEMFKAIARGGGGADAIRYLAAAQLSKHLVLLHGVFKAGLDDRLVVRGYQLLSEVQQYDSMAANTVISYPSVGAWAIRTLRGDRGILGAEPRGLSAVAAAAAIRAGLATEIEVPVTSGKVVLPSLGAANASGNAAVVRTNPAVISSADREVAVGSSTRDWHGLRRIHTGDLDVLIDDLDPFRMPAAGDLTSRLTADESTRFGTTLREAWPVLASAVAVEVSAALRAIVPCSAPVGGHISSSSPETFGAVAMSGQPNKYTCAATLVHEVQHLKLGALLDLVTLTLPDDDRRYYAPWRPDPRPVSGLLQGAYAFLGVSGFWRQQRLVADDTTAREYAHVEFARWRAAAARVVRTLESSGRLTPAGQDFIGEMQSVLAPWQHEPVTHEALVAAQRGAAEHEARWEAANHMPAS